MVLRLIAGSSTNNGLVRFFITPPEAQAFLHFAREHSAASNLAYRARKSNH